MIFNLFLKFALFASVLCQNSCYFNRECDYQLYSSKTPYDTVRGDLRDYKDPSNCEPISIWNLNRHGNRNPGSSVTKEIKILSGLKDEIVAAHADGKGELCAQDIEEFLKWTWNETMDTSASYLTEVGYEELYGIGKRLREKYPQLMTGSQEEYYFRSTDEQRTITSAIAFIHGLSERTNLDVVIDDVRQIDDVIRPYENCDHYQENVKGSPAGDDALNKFFSAVDYVAVRNAVQQRLGITTQLSTDDIYNLYELCRFFRSWAENKQSPWCAAFSNEDLVVLEYRDDVKHYYRNGYGSWVNPKLGALALKDLYQNFEAVRQGSGKKLVSYFTHDTMMEMVFSALDMYKDAEPLIGNARKADRLWRTSFIAAFSNNLIAISYRCQESGNETYKFQLLHNEKVSGVCPATGCTWDQFMQKFQPFANANLDFCDLGYLESTTEAVVDGAEVAKVSWVLLIHLLIVLIWSYR